MTIGIISHTDCLLHDTGEGHPERKERVAVIDKALKEYHFKHKPKFHEAPLATQEQLQLAHDASFINWIFSIAPEENHLMVDEDTIMSPGTLTAALRAAGAVIMAVDLVMQSKHKTVFCNIRPPGHHAETEKAMGFCFFNNVAVGVNYAIHQYSLKKIAIIDFDVHHGNGTQNIFEHNPHVLLCSSFQHPFYPGYDDESDNKHIINVPLSEGTEGPAYRAAVEAAWFDKINAFKPELIFISAGFDAHHKDPVGGLKLTVEDYEWLTKSIVDLAKKHCEGRIISVLEGGYSLEALAETVPIHVNALSESK